MIINVEMAKQGQGYISTEGAGIYYPFFPTCNAAFRRSHLNAAGLFDGQCVTGEDVDMSIRFIKMDRELWYEPAAIITHHHRRTIPSLLKQWYYYGRYRPYLWKKHSEGKTFDLYVNGRETKDGVAKFAAKCALSFHSRLCGMVFLSYNLFMLLLLLMFLVSGVVSGFGSVPAYASVCGAAVVSMWHVRGWLDWRHPLQTVPIVIVRLLVDASYCVGGIVGGIKEGIVFIDYPILVARHVDYSQLR